MNPVPALQIFQNGPTVEIRVTADGETHLIPITPREAYTLATFTEWLYDETGREMPSTLANLPDHVAVDLGSEVCPSCPTPHERPVLYFAAAIGEGLADVHTVELRHPLDLRGLPVFLFTAAVAADPLEPNHV